MIRLYNHTRYDNQLLRDIFNFAARVNRVCGDVPVKVTPSKQIRAGGMAYREFPYRKTLIGKPTTSADRRTLKCPVGWVSTSLPRVLERPWVLPEHSDYKDRAGLALEAAEWFVDVAIHELAHIRQFRDFKWASERYRGHLAGRSRRQKHDSRPCEIDAENAVYDVHHNTQQEKRRKELVSKLAAHLEAANSIWLIAVAVEPIQRSSEAAPLADP